MKNVELVDWRGKLLTLLKVNMNFFINMNYELSDRMSNLSELGMYIIDILFLIYFILFSRSNFVYWIT